MTFCGLSVAPFNLLYCCGRMFPHFGHGDFLSEQKYFFQALRRIFRARLSRVFKIFCCDLVFKFKLYYMKLGSPCFGLSPVHKSPPLALNFAYNRFKLPIHLPQVLYFSVGYSVSKTFNFRAFLVFIVRKSHGICN
jgi:hypothetical protein